VGCADFMLIRVKNQFNPITDVSFKELQPKFHCTTVVSPEETSLLCRGTLILTAHGLIYIAYQSEVNLA
jgi:hypothetical protein